MTVSKQEPSEADCPELSEAALIGRAAPDDKENEMDDCEYAALTLRLVGVIGAAVMVFRVGEWWGWRSARKHVQKILDKEPNHDH